MTSLRIDIHHHFHVAARPAAATDPEAAAPATLEDLTVKMDELIAAFAAEAERDTNATNALVQLFNDTLDKIGTVAVDAPAELESVLAAFRGNTDTLVAAALKGTAAEEPAPVDPAPASDPT